MSCDLLVLVQRAMDARGLTEAAELAATAAAFDRQVLVLATGPAAALPWPAESLQLLRDSGVPTVRSTANSSDTPDGLLGNARAASLLAAAAVVLSL